MESMRFACFQTFSQPWFNPRATKKLSIKHWATGKSTKMEMGQALMLSWNQKENRYQLNYFWYTSMRTGFCLSGNSYSLYCTFTLDHATLANIQNGEHKTYNFCRFLIEKYTFFGEIYIDDWHRSNFGCTFRS